MSRWFRLLIRGLLGVGILLGFFVAYNYFLIDRSLEQIRFALNSAARGNGVFENENASLLFQDVLVSEITKEKVSLDPLITSDALQRIPAAGETPEQKTDTQFLLQNLLSSYEKERSPILKSMDRLNHFLVDQFFGFMNFLKYIFIKPEVTDKTTAQYDEQQSIILLKAREYELKWKFEEAAKTFHLFISRYPNYPKLNLVQLNLASVYMRARHYELAEKTLSGIRLTLASPAEIQLAAALKRKLKDLMSLSGKRRELREEIHELERTSVEKTEAAKKVSGVLDRLRAERLPSVNEALFERYFQLGVFDLHLFDLENAQDTFEALLDRHPSAEMEKQAKWILGWIHLLRSNYSESRRLMKELLERFPEDRYSKLGTYALSSIAERTGDYEEAAQGFEKLAKQETSKNASFLLKYRAGGVYLYRLQDLSRAQTILSDAKQSIREPFLAGTFDQDVLPVIQANLRDSAFQKLFQGDIVTAKKFFEDMLRINPDDAWGNCGYGLALYIGGQKQEGRDYVSRCRSLKKDEYTSSCFAFIQEQEGKLEDAIALYQEAIQIRPGYAVALYNLGRLEILSGQLDHAVEHLRQAKAGGSRAGVYLPSVLNNLGLALWRLGHPEQAEMEFQNALEQNPNFADAHYNLAKLFEMRGETDLAALHLAAMQTEPKNHAKEGVSS